ncbi:MAG TPA: gephyrin-like molybdotransferase Glp [Sphingobacteriaceae bacterium]
MISISEARAIIQKHVFPLPTGQLPLSRGAGLTLAADVYAGENIPAFPQSSMDGYAFAFRDWDGKNELRISGVVAAGDRKSVSLTPGTAVRIFTGAAVPEGADTVVMQEKVAVADGRLIISDHQLREGANVRPQGSEIRSGTLALRAGTPLTPGAIGFLAGIGLEQVPVFPYPSVTIIVTGNELQSPGQKLEYGQVYESNSYTLLSALEQVNIRSVHVVRVEDDPAELTATLHNSLIVSDLVLLTGGVSVGDYDYVPQAAAACGITPVFYKVRQRPGKPLYVGKLNQKLVFGLPGNPSSVLTCFYMHVLPVLSLLSNRKIDVPSFRAPLGRPCQKAAGLTHFLKGNFEGQTVCPLDAQESYRMHSFARANCLIELPEEETDFPEGTMVTVHLLPGN